MPLGFPLGTIKWQEKKRKATDSHVLVAKVFRKTRCGLIVQRLPVKDHQDRRNGSHMSSVMRPMLRRGVLKGRHGRMFYRVTIIHIGPYKITLLF